MKEKYKIFNTINIIKVLYKDQLFFVVFNELEPAGISFIYLIHYYTFVT